MKNLKRIGLVHGPNTFLIRTQERYKSQCNPQRWKENCRGRVGGRKTTKEWKEKKVYFQGEKVKAGSGESILAPSKPLHFDLWIKAKNLGLWHACGASFASSGLVLSSRVKLPHLIISTNCMLLPVQFASNQMGFSSLFFLLFLLLLSPIGM